MLQPQQQVLAAAIDRQPEVTVTWFQPDERKEGGSYVTATGRLKKVDTLERTLVLTDSTEIPLDDVLDMESECLQGILQEEF